MKSQIWFKFFGRPILSRVDRRRRILFVIGERATFAVICFLAIFFAGIGTGCSEKEYHNQHIEGQRTYAGYLVLQDSTRDTVFVTGRIGYNYTLISLYNSDDSTTRASRNHHVEVLGWKPNFQIVSQKELANWPGTLPEGIDVEKQYIFTRNGDHIDISFTLNRDQAFAILGEYKSPYVAKYVYKTYRKTLSKGEWSSIVSADETLVSELFKNVKLVDVAQGSFPYEVRVQAFKIFVRTASKEQMRLVSEQTNIDYFHDIYMEELSYRAAKW